MSGAADPVRAGEDAALAVYTVLYPDALQHLPEYWDSLRTQLGPGFEAYFSLDDVCEAQVRAVVGDHPRVRYLPAAPGATPASLRSDALARLTRAYAGVVLIDADDLPLPGHLAAAARGLETADVHACALHITDFSGQPLPGAVFTLAPEQAAALPGAAAPDLADAAWLARVNAFGFGNSAYRSAVLAACLPVPAEAVLVDWLVASRAYLAGASFAFDREPRMLYRQYPDNTAAVLPPFSAARVARDARRVARHHALLLDHPHATVRDVAPFVRARRLSEGFLEWLEGGAEGERAAEYAARLASVARPVWLWWEHVAAEPRDDGGFSPPHYR